MIWEFLGSMLIGLALGLAASRRLPDRLPAPRVVLATGPAGALFGAYLTHAALGPGHLTAVLVGAVSVGAVSLSLLVRPAGRRLGRAGFSSPSRV